MGDQSTNTSSFLVPDGFRSLDSDDESEADSLHIESAQDITLPFSTHLPDFLPNLDTVTVTLGLDDNPNDELVVTEDVANDIIHTTGLPPVTPTKPQDAPTTLDPITPTANLKLLMSAVSPEIRSMEKRQKSKALFNAIVQAASQENLELQQSMEFEVDVETSSQGEDFVEDGDKPSNRKAKSLGLLCQRFLSKYPDYPNNGHAMEISLDAISKELCVERRRIYDIVNVLESVELVQRQAKNKYLWHGKTHLVQTLVKLKCLGERNDYANQMERLKKIQVDKDYQQEVKNGRGRSKWVPLKDFTNTAGQPGGPMEGKRFLEDDPNARKDKSLGVMSQKFIMLFLVSKNQLVTLDIAARVLIGDINYEIVENSKFKTKVRRLYDIANILTSLNMIKKVHIHERRGRKPAFRWIGPNPDISDIDLSQYDLQSKPVFRHSHFPPPVATSTCASSTATYQTPIRPKTRGKKMSSLTRHASFNIMRKPMTSDGSRHCSSAPSSPAKMNVSKETNDKFQKEFDTLRTKYPDCMSKLFAACNIEKERIQQQEEEKEQQVTSKEVSDEDSEELEVSDQLQTARKVLNLDDAGNSDKSQTADLRQEELSTLLTETVDSLHCALRDADRMRRSKRTIKQPISDEYEYQPVVKKSKVEHQALAALQKCSDPSGQKTHITLQRVKTENLTERVMSELTKKQTDPQVAEELPPDLAMLQESVGMAKPGAAVVVEMRKGSAFVPVSSIGQKTEVKMSIQKQDSHVKVVIKPLPSNGVTEQKSNLPLIRNPTRTIPIPHDFVKKLLCNEKLDSTGDVPTNNTKSKVDSVNSENIFVSTKPVNPALVKSPGPSTKEVANTSPPAVSLTNSSAPKTAQTSMTSASSKPATVVISSPNSPPFQSIATEEIKNKQLPSSQTDASQVSSLSIPHSPYSQLSLSSSLGSVGELDRMFVKDSQVSAQCRSKSVSPIMRVVQGGSPSPIVTISSPSPAVLVNSNIKVSATSLNNATNISATSLNNATNIPSIQTFITAGATATVATPVRLGLPMPITRVTTTPRQVTLIPGPGATIPAVNQNRIGQFMPMSSVLPPHPAGHLPMHSTLCSPMHPCISNATCIPTTNHIAPYTSASPPAGLITPTSSSMQCTNDINFYRTPTSLPLGSIQPKPFLTGQTLGMPTGTPYVLSGVGGSIGQLQPVSRRLTLALPPSSQH